MFEVKKEQLKHFRNTFVSIFNCSLCLVYTRLDLGYFSKVKLGTYLAWISKNENVIDKILFWLNFI